MATLTTQELAVLRREVGDGVVPITWDKATINAALQGVEDVLEAQAFDASSFVAVDVVTDARAQSVKGDLDGNRIPFTLRPVVEDWLVENTPSTTSRSVDITGIATWAQDNQAAFATVVSAMPNDQQAKIVRLIVRRRVEVVV